MRTKMLRVRLSESEWAVLEQRCAEVRRSMSDYVRLRALTDWQPAQDSRFPPAVVNYADKHVFLDDPNLPPRSREFRPDFK